ncbi:RNA polymerase sigma factor [Cellulomonas fimi]|uniref:RNA polymerase sigma factor n=1 Tax=Cellulomonas fimi TaxID=1708 RepID=UPI00235A20CF|nr:sigma-70 family RNA polymerase sigma factor [Cellulomonas fimi]
MSRRWEAMLDVLLSERYGSLVAYATLLTGSREEAQDVVHDALVSVFRSRARFGSLPQAESYVRRAVASRWVDQTRRRASERSAVRRLSGHAPDAGATLEHGLFGADVVRALGALPPRTRACVVLRHVEDLSVRETANVLGISEGAVKRYVADGVGALSAALGPVVQDEGEPGRVDVLRSGREGRRDG